MDEIDVISIPIAIMVAGGVLKYEEGKEINRLISNQEMPDNFAELVMQFKKAVDRANEKLLLPVGS